MTANGAKDPACVDPDRQHPAIDRLSDPKGHWHGPNVTTLTNQVHDGPMSLVDASHEIARPKPVYGTLSGETSYNRISDLENFRIAGSGCSATNGICYRFPFF
jgi:hypothetical protein